MQGILIGVVAAFVVFITIIGPEKHGSHFEKHKAAFEEGGGRDDATVEDDEGGPAVGPDGEKRRESDTDSAAGSANEKTAIREQEKV